MGVKLMLDGKPIGEMGADGEIKDAAGAVVKTEPVGDDDKNKLKIPLVTPFDQAAIAPVTKVPLEPEGGDKPPAKAEPDTELALKNRILEKQVSALQQSLQQQGSKAQVTEDPDGNVALELGKTIPDDLNAENDPLGVARALKGMASIVGKMSTKVSRMDQHTGYNEFNRVLENEKGLRTKNFLVLRISSLQRNSR